MLEQLTALFVDYGLLVIAIILLGTACGLPLPATFMLVTAGAFVERGALSFWSVLSVALAAAVTGDFLAYRLGRRGGALIRRWIPPERFATAERVMARWGMGGIFLTRALLPPIGPTVNLICGITRFPLRRFGMMVVPGELIWVASYVSLGRIFSHQIHWLNELLSDLSWAAVGVAAMVVFAVVLIKTLREKHHAHDDNAAE